MSKCEICGREMARAIDPMDNSHYGPSFCPAATKGVAPTLAAHDAWFIGANLSQHRVAELERELASTRKALEEAERQVVGLYACLHDHGPIREPIAGSVSTCNRWDEEDAQALTDAALAREEMRKEGKG